MNRTKLGLVVKRKVLFLFVLLCLFLFPKSAEKTKWSNSAFGINAGNSDIQESTKIEGANSVSTDRQQNIGAQIYSSPINNTNNLSHSAYRHYLKFYRIRFFDDEQATPLPLNQEEFTISSSSKGFYPGLENYIYSFVGNIRADNVLFRDNCENGPYASEHVVALKKPEIEELFDKYGRGQGRVVINRDIIQRRDIEKLHQILTREHPEWYKNGFDIKYGVHADLKGNVILNKNKLASKDSSDLEYQQGKTIIIPETLNDNKEANFFFNFNNPTVREYAIRNCLKVLSLNKDNSLFIDGVTFSYRQHKNRSGDRTFYTYKGNETEQIHHYTDQYISIVKEIKRRSDAKIFINGLTDRDSRAITFYERICSGENWDYFDGVMIENRFWFDDDWRLLGSWRKINPHDYDPNDPRLERSFWCGNIGFYLDWIDKFKKKSKKLLFAASPWTSRGTKQEFSEDSPLIYNIWLWYHLIADDNTYFYLNQDYAEKATSYAVYDFPLGYPLGKPYKRGNTWYRKYQRGTIIFDTTYGELRDIRFVEK